MAIITTYRLVHVGRLAGRSSHLPKKSDHEAEERGEQHGTRIDRDVDGARKVSAQNRMPATHSAAPRRPTRTPTRVALR
jgi:hypothetical protein